MIELILSSLIIFGIHATARPNMIFAPIKMWIAKIIEKILSRKYDFYEAENKTAYVLKPLFDCPPCMASVWGTVIYFSLDIQWPYLVFVFSLSGLNYLIINYMPE